MSEGPESAFEAIWAQAARVLPADGFYVALCGPGPNQVTYELAVERGVRQPRRTRELGDGLGELVLRTRNPLLVRNFETEKGSIPLSWMGVPLVLGERILGLMVAQSHRQGAFDERDLALLGALAGWAAGEVDRVRRQREESESATALVRLAGALARERDLDGLLRAAAEVLPGLLKGSRCSTWSWTPGGREFRPAWQGGDTTGATRLAAPPMAAESSPALADLLQTRTVLALAERDAWRLGGAVGLRPPGGRPVALLPVAAEGEVVGLVAMVGDRAGEPFSAREVDLLRGLAEILGLAARSLRPRAGDVPAPENLDETRSRLISTISHELRTPLSLVVTGTELLMGQLAHPDQVRQVAGLVNQGAARLAEVVDDIIEFSDLQSGLSSNYVAATNVAALVRDAMDDAAGAANAHRVALEVAGEVPTLWVDGSKLEAVVAKLVRNALNFSAEPSRVLVRLAYDAAMLKVEVHDSGYGIPQDELDRVFEPFFRGRTAQGRCISGTGLGLSVAGQMVDLMGGRIEIRSQVDQGTTVDVALPAGTSAPGERGALHR